VDVDARVRTSRGPLTNSWLCGDARGRHGSVREELATGVRRSKRPDPPTLGRATGRGLTQRAGDSASCPRELYLRSGLPPPQFGRVGPRTWTSGAWIECPCGPNHDALAPSPGGAFSFRSQYPRPELSGCGRPQRPSFRNLPLAPLRRGFSCESYLGTHNVVRRTSARSAMGPPMTGRAGHNARPARARHARELCPKSRLPPLSLRLAPSAGEPIANTVSECEANDQNDCAFQH